MENHKESPKKLLELMNQFSKVVEYMINVQRKKKSAVFLCTSSEQSENEIKKISFIIG